MSGSLLNQDDLRRLLACIRELSAVSEVEDFHGHVASIIQPLMTDDWVSCESFMQGSLAFVEGYVTPDIPPDLYDLFTKRAIENPMIKVLQGKYGGKGIQSWQSMLGSDKAIQKTPLYHDFYKPLQINHQLAMWSFENDGTVFSMALSREHEHSESEQQTLSLLQPHLLNGYRTWRAMQDLRREPMWLAGALERAGAGVVLLDAGGGVLRWTEFAEQLLTGYFKRSRRAPGQLPREVADWVEACLLPGPDRFVLPAPYVCVGDFARLSIRLTRAEGEGAYLLILQERSSVPGLEVLRSRFGLSERRAEVLRLIAAGRTNPQIAEVLGLSLGTVRKHVELLFRDLGVNSRAEAVSHLVAGDA